MHIALKLLLLSFGVSLVILYMVARFCILPVHPLVGFDSYRYIFVWTSATLVVRGPINVARSSTSHVFG
jgi:hypothetical protein